MARKGNQKPTTEIKVSTRNSLFKEAIDIYEKSGRKAQRWQSNLLKVILARNSKGLWIHTKYGYSLPRRNGKNEVVAIREMYGLCNGEKIMHTAHRTSTSHAAWERLCGLLDKAGIKYDSLKARGQEQITLLEGEGRIDFRTRSSKGGLGEGFDLLIIDEAQEYTDDQESALKYVVTDSQNPQTIFCGTPPTPLSSGTVFVNMRTNALQGGIKNTGWAEWSVEKETDPYDKESWYLTNPSLGTVFTERSVEDEIGTDIVDFNIQRLGLWLKYNQKSAISVNDWDSLRVSKLPLIKNQLHVGIKYGVDGNNVAMSIAAKTESGDIFVEAIDCQTLRNGNGWVIDFLKQADINSVVIDGANGQTLLAKEMKDYRLKQPVLPTVKEIILANSKFEQAVYAETISHLNQPSLTQVITNCEKRTIGQNGGFGYKAQFDEHEIALMDSIILAHWSCSEEKPKIKQMIRY